MSKLINSLISSEKKDMTACSRGIIWQMLPSKRRIGLCIYHNNTDSTLRLPH